MLIRRGSLMRSPARPSNSSVIDTSASLEASVCRQQPPDPYNTDWRGLTGVEQSVHTYLAESRQKRMTRRRAGAVRGTSMIEISRSLIVNDGTQPELSVDDVWAGLQEKAANPMPYVKSITSCTVID